MTTMKADYAPTARGMCELHADAVAQLMPRDNATTLEGWLIEHGAQEFAWQPRPDGFERMTPNECFRNAYLLASDDNRLSYYEGFAVTTSLPVHVHHAWCANEDGHLIEPTFPDDVYEKTTYFGVNIPTKVLREIIVESETYSVLYKRFAIDLIEKEVFA